MAAPTTSGNRFGLVASRGPSALRLWFPVALGVLVLLAIPALILLAAHLLGKENALNGWLRQSLGLSYHVPVPIWACVILVLLPLLLLLLYFLKLKRQPLAVPSTYLWRKSIEDLQVNSLFQWLRRNVLLLLQLLTLLLLLYALLGPQLFANLERGRRYIIVLDSSASMAATDLGSSRLEKAKEEALKEIDAYGDNDVGMVIEFNSRSRVLQTFTTDRDLLRRAVRQVTQTQRITRIDDALLQADGRANPTRTTDDQAVRPADEDPEKAREYVRAAGSATEVHLFSDGGFPDVSDFALGNLQLRYHMIGKAGAEHVNNVGLVALTAERDDRNPRTLKVFGRARHFGARPVKVRVGLEVTVDGVLQPGLREQWLEQGREVRRDEPNHGVFEFKVPGLPEQGNVVVQARLVDHKDDLKVDDEAQLVVGVMRQARVLVVRSSSNLFLESFFDEAVRQRLASVTYFDKDDLKDDRKYTVRAQQGEWDLVVFDRCAPASEEALPFANTFFIDAVPPPFRRSSRSADQLDNPRVRGWDTRHPLLRGLTGLQEIDIAKAFRFDLKDPRVPVKTPRLLEIDRDNAVLFTLPRRSFTDVVMTFPLINDKGEWNTFWPLKLNFLLFMRNLVVGLGNVRGDEWVRPGEVKYLHPDTTVTRLEVIDPRRQTFGLDRGQRAEFAFDRTDLLGIYEVRWNDAVQRAFAVNLLDSQESNLEPRTQFQVGAVEVVAGEERRQPRDLWKLVAVGALALLLLEWYVYNRRILF